MANIKGLVDDNGVIYECNKILPEEFKIALVEVLAELENNECHKTRVFPKSQLHKIQGVKNVYRVYIDKITGWRLHVQYGEDKRLHLCDVLEPVEHDRSTNKKVIQRKKGKYNC